VAENIVAQELIERVAEVSVAQGWWTPVQEAEWREYAKGRDVAELGRWVALTLWAAKEGDDALERHVTTALESGDGVWLKLAQDGERAVACRANGGGAWMLRTFYLAEPTQKQTFETLGAMLAEMRQLAPVWRWRACGWL